MITGAQIKAARRLLGWQHSVLLRRSKQDPDAVIQVESLDGEAPAELETVVREIQRALETGGVEFLEDGGVARSANPITPVITTHQIKAARKLLGWSAATLASKARRSILSIAQAESGKLPPRLEESSRLAIQSALEAAGLEFLDEAPGVRVRKPKA